MSFCPHFNKCNKTSPFIYFYVLEFYVRFHLKRVFLLKSVYKILLFICGVEFRKVGDETGREISVRIELL